MEFKGTKGKWYIGTAELFTDNKKHLLVSPINQMKEKGGYRNVCSVSVLDDVDNEDEANALLISKAPEMLEMLIEIRNQIEDGRTYITKEDINILIKEATEL